ncbi:MAG: hypothetical protein IK000_06385 [Bacteroidaceae bacterium]|nr:hypothetical protein [Bacteroidaceae bacterium]
MTLELNDGNVFTAGSTSGTRRVKARESMKGFSGFLLSDYLIISLRRILFLILLLLTSFGVRAQEEVITDTTAMSYTPIFLPMTYYRVNYTYSSVAPDGTTPVTLSAALVFPKDVFEHNKPLTVGSRTYDASGLILCNHFTITRDIEAPTQTSSMDIEAPLALLGPRCIIISPDGYGFGTTADKPQAYLMADAIARNNVDAVRAARRLLARMGYTYGGLFSQLGYSQGGHSSIAVQRYVDTHGTEPDAISHIDYTLCGDGPYDISAMLDSLMVPGARSMYPCAIPLIIQGQIEGAGLPVSYSDCLRAPLDTKAIEWLNAKVYAADVINHYIYDTVGGDKETGVPVSDILVTDNFSRTDSPLLPLYDALVDNSLVTGWRPNKDTRFWLYHSETDEVVPYFCMEHLRDFLRGWGLDTRHLNVYTTTGTHTGSAALFVVLAMNELRQMENDYLAGTYIPTAVDIVPDAASSATPAGWYTLQGQQLPAEPHTPGIYIHNGKKVLIK